jgi:hypothetical protein
MTKTFSRTRRSPEHRKQGISAVEIENRARRQLTNECPCAFYFKDVRLEYRHGVLTLRGRVPTHALKSMLERILSRVEGVDQIDNQVDVVSSTGLSSVRPK